MSEDHHLDLKNHVVKKIMWVDCLTESALCNYISSCSLYFSLGILYIFISLIVRICHFVVFEMLSHDVTICWKYFDHQ